MGFEETKKRQLEKIDLSNEGSWDVKIAPLCNKINKMKNYYTTSSCAGRIVLLKGEIEKLPDKFLFKSHKKVSLNELMKAIEAIIDKGYMGLVEFKQSPSILHVAARTLEDAQNIVDKAKFCGWKHSGIMSTKKRFMVELHSTEHIDFPIIDNGKVLVGVDMLKISLEQANMRLVRVWAKIEKLKKML